MKQIIKNALKHLTPRERRLILALSVVRTLAAILDIFGILIIGILISISAGAIVSAGNTQTNSLPLASTLSTFSIQELGLIALTLFVLKPLLAIFFMRKTSQVLSSGETQIAGELYKKLLHSPNSALFIRQRADILIGLNQSLTAATTQIINYFIIIISEFALLISISIIFALTNFAVTIFMLLYFGAIGLIIQKLLGVRLQKAGSDSSAGYANSITVIEDSLNAYREIFTLNQQMQFVEEFKKPRFVQAQANTTINYYAALPRYVIESSLIIGTLALAGYAFNVADVTTASGMLGIFLTGGFRLMASMLPMQSALGGIKQLAGQAKIFYEIEEEISGKSVQTVPEESKDNYSQTPVSLTFENVNYSYPGSKNFAVENLSFTAEPGEVIAVIGKSGAGKSTIADLIIGLITPDSGVIKFGNEEDQKVILGYLPQRVGAVSGSILKNITLNVNSNIFEPDKLNDALAASHLEEFISSLPQGINSDIGKQSDALSGGQMQRIGLARALYNCPNLVVLDEATSALDSETEQAVTEAIFARRNTCTTIIIAHRLSTIEKADKVIHIEDGRICQIGKFHELNLNRIDNKDILTE